MNGHDDGACVECGNSSKYGLNESGICDDCECGDTAYLKSKAGKRDQLIDAFEAGHDVDLRGL